MTRLSRQKSVRPPCLTTPVFVAIRHGAQVHPPMCLQERLEITAGIVVITWAGGETRIFAGLLLKPGFLCMLIQAPGGIE